MKNKLILIIFGIFLIGIFLINNLYAAGEIYYCCEKTIDGAWCQNAPENECDISDGLKAAPTSCEATSYCKKGCCYDSQEGSCMKNTPQKVCKDSGGYWSENAECDIPQCEFGCCLIGEQAAFVTQTRCKRLSSIYGLETNFRTDLSNELECIASATSSVKGACVFEKDYEKTCILTTQKECKEMESSNSDISFHIGYLCSAEILGTNCGPTQKTTCVEGKDEVYFLDSCGNLANIYDASKINDKEYWTKIKTKSESCTLSSSNSRTCGNCDYILGSTCREYKRGETTKPSYGNYICKDLGCEFNGEEYSHGETWCANSEGSDENLPGSRYFRMVCYNGEVTIEPCADFRQEICVESDVEGFRVASCRVNKWQECVSQDNKKDCENSDLRDCQWIEGVSILEDNDGRFVLDNAGKLVSKSSSNGKGKQEASCVPLYSPGLNFWKEETEGESICELGSVLCTVEYEKDFLGHEKIKNEYCLKDYWKEKNFEICTLLGDCGSSKNYLGIDSSSEMNFTVSDKE